MSKSTLVALQDTTVDFISGAADQQNGKITKCISVRDARMGNTRPLPIMIHLATNVMLDIVNGAESNAKRVQKVASRFMVLGIAGILAHRALFMTAAKQPVHSAQEGDLIHTGEKRMKQHVLHVQQENIQMLVALMVYGSARTALRESSSHLRGQRRHPLVQSVQWD